MKSNNALIVILGTVTLDAVGIGLVMPIPVYQQPTNVAVIMVIVH